MKTKEEILNQVYMNVKDFRQLTGLGLSKSQSVMKELREEAKEQGYYIPADRTILVPTKIVRKKLKI